MDFWQNRSNAIPVRSIASAFRQIKVPGTFWGLLSLAGPLKCRRLLAGIALLQNPGHFNGPQNPLPAPCPHPEPVEGGSFRAPSTHPKPRRRAFRAPLPVIPNRSREESKIHPHQPVYPRIVRRNFPTTTIKRPCAKIKSPLRQAPAFDILEPRCPRALFLFAWGCSSFGRALQWH